MLGPVMMKADGIFALEKDQRTLPGEKCSCCHLRFRMRLANERANLLQCCCIGFSQHILALYFSILLMS